MKRVLIVGGSTRAAAWSARRAGLQPVCADLFADWDTRQIAEVIEVRDYLSSLPEDVAHVAADGWFYTGGLENRADLIERIARPDATYGPLLGTPADSLRLIRDPFWLNQTLAQANIPTLEILPGTANPPRDGNWVRKPIASAGGRAVCVWDKSILPSGTSEPVYFQSRIRGVTHSAVFHNDDRNLEFLGITQQLDNPEISNAPDPFSYCGSIGPLPEDRTEVFRGAVTAVAELLASKCSLRGIFGIDFIPGLGGTVWILEVNPRYTASVEIIELASRRSLLSGRRSAFRGGELSTGTSVVAKLILYAVEPLIAPALGEFSASHSEWTVPVVADIPVPGTQIDATWPICSVMAMGATREMCLETLTLRAEEVRNRMKK